MVVLTADDDKGIGRAVQSGQGLELPRSLALWLLLVHAIQQGQLQRHGIDERHVMPAARQGALDITRDLDSLASGSHRSDEHDELHDVSSREQPALRDRAG